MATTAEALESALAHHQAGRLSQAEQIYEQVLAADPRHAGALHLWGLVALQSGQPQTAIERINQAIRLDGAQAAFHANLGEAYRALGRLDDASAAYARALRIKPHLAEAQNNFGTILQAQGNLADAVAAYERAVAERPDYADAHNNLGTAYHQQGRPEAAVECFRRAIQAVPGYARAYYNLGIALRATGHLDQAKAALRQAIDRQDTLLDARLALAKLLHLDGNFGEAEAQYRRALEIQPKFAPAHNGLGTLAQAHGKLDEAVAHYAEAARLRPDYAEALYNWGTALGAQDRLTDATEKYRRAIVSRPDFVDAHYNLGAILQQLKHVGQARAAYEEAVRLRPDYAAAHNNLGDIYYALGRADEAIASLERAVSLAPDLAEAHNNLGNALHLQGQSQRALACYQKSLELDPQLADAHHNLGLYYLIHEDFSRGWPEYMWRLKCKNIPRRAMAQPLWQGEPLAGRRLLVHAEQGFGDTLHMLRYVPLLQKSDARILLEVQPQLVPLVKCSGFADVLGGGDPLPPFDLHVPLLNLPPLFNTTLDNMPRDVPYLAADPARLARWRGKLSGMDGFKVGICWQGSTAYALDRDRSTALEYFAPLAAIAGVRLLSLQKYDGAEQLAALDGRFAVHDLARALDVDGGAFMDTAAVMAHLDLVISSDTAMAHLAGALGVRTWVALAKVPDWRWFLERDDCPWYPSMRLFRQREAGDWADVFTRMAAALSQLVQSTPMAGKPAT